MALSLTAQKRFAWGRAVFWFLAFFFVAYFGQLENIAVLTFVSFYANVAGEWSNAQAVSGEERMQQLEGKIDAIYSLLCERDSQS